MITSEGAYIFRALFLLWYHSSLPQGTPHLEKIKDTVQIMPYKVV